MTSGEVIQERQGGWVERAQAMWRRSCARWTTPGSRHLEMIETLSLGDRRQVVLLRCGSQRFLVGLGNATVSTIVAVAPEAADEVTR